MLNNLIIKVTESAKIKVLENEKIMKRISKDKETGRGSEVTESMISQIVFEEIEKLNIDYKKDSSEMNLLTSLENSNIVIAKNIIASI